MKKLFIIVLYKTNVKDCLTITSFKNCKLFLNNNNTFIIWDNSPNPNINANQDYCEQLSDNVLYESHTENTSLAKVYNNCISRYSMYDAVCIFDQDSEISQNDYDRYVDSLLIENKNIPVFLPQIFSNGKLYSPGKFWVFKGWHYKRLNEGIFKDRLYTAIMSGTIVRLKFINQYKISFNEELQLYGIDTCFFTDLRKKNPCFYLMKTVLRHNLSEEILYNDNYKMRTNIYLDGCIQTARGNIVYILLIKLYKLFLHIIGRL